MAAKPEEDARDDSPKISENKLPEEVKGDTQLQIDMNPWDDAQDKKISYAQRCRNNSLWASDE